MKRKRNTLLQEYYNAVVNSKPVLKGLKGYNLARKLLKRQVEIAHIGSILDNYDSSLTFSENVSLLGLKDKNEYSERDIALMQISHLKDLLTELENNELVQQYKQIRIQLLLWLRKLKYLEKTKRHRKRKAKKHRKRASKKTVKKRTKKHRKSTIKKRR
jgi:hypothetical protein